MIPFSSTFRRAAGTPLAVACIALSGAASPALSQDYPSRQVTLVAAFAAGSGTDGAARLIGKHLNEALHQPFVVQNVAGASGTIAAATVARAKPDGYTLLITSNSSHASAPGLMKNVPYDPIKDFTPVARIGSFYSFVGVNPDLPVKTMSELIAYAKANPSKVSCGYGNSSGQIACETLRRRTGADIVGVGYRSTPAAVTDVIAGHIAMVIADPATSMAHVKAQKMRALAVLPKSRRSNLPEVPTLDETVMPGFDLLAWTGIFAPANTPPEIVNTVAAAIHKAMQQDEVKARFANSGIEPFWGGPDEFREYVKSELTKWTAMIKEAGIQPE